MFSGLFNNSIILLRGSSYGCRKRTCVRILHFIVIFYSTPSFASQLGRRKTKKEKKRNACLAPKRHVSICFR